MSRCGTGTIALVCATAVVLVAVVAIILIWKLKTAQRKTTSWTIALLANEPYLERAKATIVECRERGDWTDDIVLMVPASLVTDVNLLVFATLHKVHLFQLPARNCNTVIEAWKRNKGDGSYEYMMSRTFIFMKFYFFDVFFKKWDVVFAMDAGMIVFGKLHTWGLRGQFSFQMLDAPSRLALSEYDLDGDDYFQSCILVYDTRILKKNTVDDLFSLAEQFPGARGDQPILNLYFMCKLGLWRQIPLRDQSGFLYDFMARSGFQNTDYRLLKISA